MATKFYNNQARVFRRLLKGEDFNDLLNSEIDRLTNTEYYCSDVEANEYRQEELSEVLKVKAFFDKIKFLEEPEVYEVNGWGYGQTNYENLKVLGQMGGSMVCIIDNDFSDIYTIQKKKYTEKAPYTYLDGGVRSTSWHTPYTDEEIASQNLYNAYYGH